jgi:type III secretory pathway component EscU
VYRSDPWKEPFYKNKAFSVIIAINILLLTAMFFTTAQLTSFTDLQPIGLAQAGVIFTIMLSTVAVCLFYNYLIKRQAFHEKSAHEQFREEIDLSKNEITEAQM